MSEAERKSQNARMLQEMYPAFRIRVEAAIEELERFGYHPCIREAWRSVEDQLEAYQKGYSKVQFGFHNISTPDGTKEALAADIIDDATPTNPKPAYLLHLAAAAQNNGLITGIRWDLPDNMAAAIDSALTQKNWNAYVRIGWDPQHVQITGMTIEEARAGKRPEMPPASPGGAGTPNQGEVKMPRYKVENLENNSVVEYELNTALKPVSLLAVPYIPAIGTGADVHRNDSGAACAVMLLRAYRGTSITPDEVYSQFAIQGDPYLTMQQVRGVLATLGLSTETRSGLSFPDMFNFLALKKPAIIPLRYKVLRDAGLTEKASDGPQFAVVVGMDIKNIYLHDPLYTDSVYGEAHTYPLDIFWKAWKETALDTRYPNPERAAILPVMGIGAPQARRVHVTAKALNVRSAPGADKPLVAVLKKDEIVEVRRELNGWGEIGENRWIHLAYTAGVE